jgi:hypothetical protein
VDSAAADPLGVPAEMASVGGTGRDEVRVAKRRSAPVPRGRRPGNDPVVITIVFASAAVVVVAAVLWAPLPRAQLMVSVTLGLAAAWFGSRSQR